MDQGEGSPPSSNKPTLRPLNFNSIPLELGKSPGAGGGTGGGGPSLPPPIPFKIVPEKEKVQQQQQQLRANKIPDTVIPPSPSLTTPTTPSHLVESSGKLKISPDATYDFTSEDLEDLGEIGRGAYGTVNKMIHRGSATPLAVKRIRCTVDEREQKKLMMDLDVVMKSNPCPFIVKFYGAIFKEGDCWICMELMDASLDQFYKFVYRKLGEVIVEDVIGKIALVVVQALNYLHASLKIIHRDIKPSNILLDRNGGIKLCDFGISGQLVDSIAQSRDAGCRPYMAPERIDPSSARGYDIRSDVWSLGITLYEISTGRFPYRKWNSIFEQLCQVVEEDPPQLQKEMTVLVGSGTPSGEKELRVERSVEFVGFVNTCLIKDELQRPKYSRLLQHPFLIKAANDKEVDVRGYLSRVFEEMGDLVQQRLENLTLVDDDVDFLAGSM